MNIELRNMTPSESEGVPTREEVASALETLRRAASLDPTGTAGSVVDTGVTTVGLNRSYPADFVPDHEYRASMPDLQNGPSSLIKGARRGIQHVGISNFRLPLAYQPKAGDPLTLETSVTGSVSLDATKKGINMSRIMRSFYRHSGQVFDHGRLVSVLESYLSDLESSDARLALSFRYPILRPSLRSGLEGYQYYHVTFETVLQAGVAVPILHLDYVYSSTCPCSLELSEHARTKRGQIATPHSQRSVARLSVRLQGDEVLWIEDLVDLCNRAIPTETQVMVKREDEQAFAELNGSHPIFVEDAVRLLCEALEGEARIGDFRVMASHQESLHSHDAVSILCRGETFAQVSYDPRTFATLHHVG